MSIFSSNHLILLGLPEIGFVKMPAMKIDPFSGNLHLQK